MSGGSKSGGTQKVEQTVELPEWQEEHLKRIASEAGRTYNSNFSGFAPYPGATYVPMNSDQIGAMDWTRSLLGSNPFLAPSFAGWGDIQAGSGMLSGQRDALANTKAALGGYSGVRRLLSGMDGFRDLYRDIRSADFGDSGREDELYRDLQDGVAGQWGMGSMYRSLAKDGVAGQDELEDWLGASKPLASERYLTKIARGDYLDGSNPYLDDIIGQATSRAQDATSSLFSGAGRYGGGAHQGVAAREAGEIATDFLGREYDMERQRQLAAAGQIDQATLGRRGQELSGIGQMSQTDLARQGLMRGLLGDRAGIDLERHNLMRGLLGDEANREIARYGLMQGALEGDLNRYGTMLDAIGGKANASLALGGQYAGARDAMMQNMQLAPMLREMQFSDPERLMRLGTLQQGELQSELQSMIDRWDAKQAMPLRELEYYSSIVNGLPNMASSTQTSSSRVPTSPVSGLLGGALTGGTLASQLGLLGGAAGMSNPLGWGLLGGGALLGGLGSIF